MWLKKRSIQSRGANFARAGMVLRTAIALTSTATLASTLAGCKANSNVFKAENASVGNGDGSSVDAAAGFKLTLKAKSGVDSFIHKFGDVNANCEIAKADKDNPQDIKCMANFMEYDLWAYGFEYNLNIPSGFCNFLEEGPYRYYMAEGGYGPSTLNMAVDATGAITTCTIDGIPGTISSGSTCSNGEAVFGSDGSVLACAYDYSKDTANPGPNCCAGRLTGNINKNGTSSPINTVYGGSLYNCIESPMDYVSGWPKVTGATTKAAIRITTLNGASLNTSQKLQSPLQLASSRLNRRSIFLLAGFYNWAGYAADFTTWGSSALIPRALAPLRDRGAAGTHTAGGTGTTSIGAAGDGSYEFSCKGAAGELRHHIRLYVNAWNTIEDYQGFKATGDATKYTPNRTGTAGVDCAAVNGTGSCNSFWGFDDMINDTTIGWGGFGNPNAWVFPRDFDIQPNPY